MESKRLLDSVHFSKLYFNVQRFFSKDTPSAGRKGLENHRRTNQKLKIKYLKLMCDQDDGFALQLFFDALLKDVLAHVGVDRRQRVVQ